MKIVWVKIKEVKQFLKNNKLIKIIKELIVLLNKECLIIKVEKLYVKKMDPISNKPIIILILIKNKHNNLIHNGNKLMIALVLLKIIKNIYKHLKNPDKCKLAMNPGKSQESENQKIKANLKEVLFKKDSNQTTSQ